MHAPVAGPHTTPSQRPRHAQPPPQHVQTVSSSPSSHGVPSGALVSGEHCPLSSRQVPATLHELVAAGQTTPSQQSLGNGTAGHGMSDSSRSPSWHLMQLVVEYRSVPSLAHDSPGHTSLYPTRKAHSRTEQDNQANSTHGRKLSPLAWHDWASQESRPSGRPDMPQRSLHCSSIPT